MRKNNVTRLKTLVLATGLAMVYSPVSHALSLEERVERLERMANNPVVLKLTQQLNAQKRELQSVQNRLDLLLHQMQKGQDSTTSDQASLPEEIKRRLEVLEAQQIAQQQKLDSIEQSMMRASGDAKPVAGLAPMPAEAIPSQQTDVGAGGNGNLSPQNVETPQINENPPPASKTVQNPASLTVPTEPVKTRSATESEEASYQAAFELMRKAKYQASVAAFTRFALENSQSALAPNAWYWAGEGQYILGDNASAKQAFTRVIEIYPNSSKGSDARLRLADTLVKLGNPSAAKDHYQYVIENFSGSRAAENAQKRLSNL